MPRAHASLLLAALLRVLPGDAQLEALEAWRPDALTVRLGGSLPLGQTQSDVERAALQGLLLLASEVNKSKPFVGPGGIPLLLSLQVEDDGGDMHRAKEIYARMAARQEVDFFVGLHSSRLSQVVAEVGNSTEMPTLLSGTLPGAEFQWVFAVGVPAGDLLRGTLALTSAQTPAARSVAALWDASSDFHSRVCEGALRHAGRLGLQVLDNVSVGEEAIMLQMRHVQALRPDLIVGCGNLRTSERILLSADTLGFLPMGIVLTGASPRSIVDSIGPYLANYIMTPTPWAPSPYMRCPVFGSAEGFAEAYRQMWGEEPLPESAAAAGAGMALLAAVREVVQSSGLQMRNRSAVREALLALNLETCYARIAFDAEGARLEANGITQQVQPLSEDRPRKSRWTKSNIVTLGSKQPPSGWPLPTWEQKEVDVYPCGAGEEAVPNSDSTVMCEPCAVGRYRNPVSVVCEDCEPGTYGMEAGMTQCQVCPAGAHCPGGALPGGPAAKAGYYLLPEGDTKIVKCWPPELCLGNNECQGAHTGILCRGCQEGYHLPLFGLNREHCTVCPEESVSTWTIAMTILIYMLYIWLIVKGTLSASQSIRAIHSVVLKICVNYLQFAGTAFEATDFKAMLLSVCGRSAGKWLMPFVALPERLQYPLTTLVSLDCLLARSGIRQYQVQIVLGLSLMPLAFFLMTVLAMVRKDCIRKRVIPWLRRRAQQAQARAKGEVMPNIRNVVDPELGAIDEQGEASVSAKRRLDVACASPNSAMHCLTPKSKVTNANSLGAPSPSAHRGDDFTPMSLYAASPTPVGRAATGEDSAAIHTKSTTKVFVNSMATRFVNSVIVMSFILHPVVVRLLVVGFECDELDVLRQRHDLEVQCRSNNHMLWLTYSTVGLLVYGLGVPVSLFYALFRVRKRLLVPEVRKRYGFLYNGFELRYYYFESVYMFRKVMILLFFTAPTMYVRMVLLLFTSFGFILLHVHTQPFDNRSYLCLDRLEGLNLIALTVTVSARLIYDLRKELSGQFFEELANHWFMALLLVLAPLMAHATFVGYALWCLFRNSVLKHLLLKADVWPEKMTRLQQCILGIERHKQKATFDEDDRGLWMDTSSLSKREQHYLFVALCDTLHRYMDSCHRVHPSDISAAVREALVRCRHARRKRAVRLEQLARRHDQRGCLSRLLRWQGEMSLSLHGVHKPDEPQEPGCFGTLLHWAAGDGNSRRRGLPEKALHMEMEQSQEFSVEEFYDALMPVWQEITEGYAPQLSPRGTAGPAVRSMSELMKSQRSVDGQGLARTRSDDDKVSSASDAHSCHSSHLRLDALLGRTQGFTTVESGAWDDLGIEDLLENARAACRNGMPDANSVLLRLYDTLLAEHQQLQRENEDLRRRAPGSAKPSQEAGVEPAAPCQGQEDEEAEDEEAEDEQAEDEEAQDEEAEASEEEDSCAPPPASTAAPSAWRVQAPPASPNAVGAAAAAALATASQRPGPMERPPSKPEAEGAPRAEQLLELVPGAPRAEQLLELPKVPGAPRAEQLLELPKAPVSHFSPTSLQPKQQRQPEAALLLPLPSAAERANRAYLAPEVGSASHASRGSRSRGSNGSPWSSAMRPTNLSAWSTRDPVPESEGPVAFEFMGAARPVNPEAWPQVE